MRPEYGIRLTGKVNKTNLALFSILTREPARQWRRATSFTGSTPSTQWDAVAQDFGKGSSVGLIYTDEDSAVADRVGGLDLTLRLNNSWDRDGQTVESSTMGDRDSGTPTALRCGWRPMSRYAMGTRSMRFRVPGHHAGCQTQLGFLQTSNIRSDSTHATYQWFPKHSWVQSYGLEENLNLAWDHAENRVYHYTTVDPFLLLPHNIVIAPLIGGELRHAGPAKRLRV